MADLDPKPVEFATKVTDAVAVKAYLTAKTGVKVTELTKLLWSKPEDIIESAVKLHGAKIEDYRAGGLR